jgi:hypothetical protein
MALESGIADGMLMSAPSAPEALNADAGASTEKGKSLRNPSER